ncbi:hypothetical protein [Aquimarina litoralis]|uniref:hypothetical protein n=1 Tax=Aquimarina litoralis TaxID=584605 RepID=UPI001C561F9F|nr:hypothetical protein [Aquimarina litoralis]MBW1295222.1 hypothetical protein [Aquimarina litoralis]
MKLIYRHTNTIVIMNANTNMKELSVKNFDSISISKFRCYLMKGLYLLTFVTLGYSSWSEILNPNEQWGPYDGITYSFWAAYALLMGLGIRYPLKMLPLLLLQLFYKSIFFFGIYVPLWSSGNLPEAFDGFLKPFAIGIPIDLLVIPWIYVYKTYIKNLFKFY